METPQSLEAEQGILSCILICPSECLPEAIEAGCCEEWFNDSRNQVIWPVVAAADKGLDLITLQSKLKDQGRLEAVGGLAYLSELMDKTPSAANLSYYLTIAKEKYQLRRSIAVGSAMVQKAQSHEADPSEILEQAERDVLAIRGSVVETAHSAKPLMMKVVDRLEKAMTNPGAITGLTTGFPDLDKKLLGLKPGLYGIAARPSLGKTSLTMNIVEHVAVDCKEPVGVLSLETSAETLAFRMTCSRARVNSKNAAQGILDERDYPRLVHATSQISNAPLYIEDQSGLTISMVKAKFRRLKQRYGIKLGALDYLQLLSSLTKNGTNRDRELAQVSIGLKEIARDLALPIIVVIAINREQEKEERRPRLSDLRECGQIEYDLDALGMLFRPRESNAPPPDPNDLEHPVTMFIAKNKEGDCGDVPLFFRKQFTRFESASRVMN
jgi:replicative DNA helicase